MVAGLGWEMAIWILLATLQGEVSEGEVLRSSGVGSGATRAEAAQAAEDKASEELLGQLGRLAYNLTGWRLSHRTCWEEYLWLSQEPDVSKTKEISIESKQYGDLATAEITLTLSEGILLRWQERLKEKHREWFKLLVRGGLGTVGGWLVWLTILTLWDRRTQGYRRGLILVVGLIVGTTLTAAVCVWIFAFCY